MMTNLTQVIGARVNAFDRWMGRTGIPVYFIIIVFTKLASTCTYDFSLFFHLSFAHILFLIFFFHIWS